MDEQIQELFDKAEDDLQTAVKLAAAIIYGHIEVELVDLLEMYYLLKKWQITAEGKNNDDLATLAETYETALKNINAELLDDYMYSRKNLDIYNTVIETVEQYNLPRICIIDLENIPQA